VTGLQDARDILKMDTYHRGEVCRDLNSRLRIPDRPNTLAQVEHLEIPSRQRRRCEKRANEGFPTGHLRRGRQVRTRRRREQFGVVVVEPTFQK
jgi:hypothetical protein